jgi:hypothetical protein
MNDNTYVGGYTCLYCGAWVPYWSGSAHMCIVPIPSPAGSVTIILTPEPTEAQLILRELQKITKLLEKQAEQLPKLSEEQIEQLRKETWWTGWEMADEVFCNPNCKDPAHGHKNV